MSTQEQQYIRGFNHGYLLTKHLPELAGKLAENVPAAPGSYFEGFSSGKEEYELERNREQLKDLSNIRWRSEDRERD